MKSESWLIIQFSLVLLAFGTLSFFFTPVYEKGAWEIMTIFSTALGTMMGYKFGKSMPQQSGDVKPGQATESVTTTKTASTEQPPPEPPKV